MSNLNNLDLQVEPYSVCAVYFNLNITEFRDLVKEVVRSACRAALTEAGFIPDDYLVDVESAMDGTFLRKQPLL